MITNMHVVPEWKSFLMDYRQEAGRYTALCGKRTTPKYMGLPGRTPQPIKADNGRSGWCPTCMQAVLTELLLLQYPTQDLHTRQEYQIPRDMADKYMAVGFLARETLAI